MPDSPDLACVQAAQAGTREALDTLLTACWPDAYRIARGILGESALAEESAQEACAHLVLALAELREPAAFRGWFYRLVVNAARATMRRERRHRSSLPLDDQIERVDPETDDATLDRLGIERALLALPSMQREAIVLHYYADLTSKEIARVVGAPDGTIRYRLFLAKRRLRVLLGERRDAAPAMTEVNGHA
ncbi:MAG: sigma-70 family RNA polymerase sigma factor [Candidatus Eremiobacteraeota bacterium]|nr:sigma-70 family RNA polymerase sigma factor [Candidatus Eremiobacteraeota bacterium]